MFRIGRRECSRPSRSSWLALATIITFTACSGAATNVTPGVNGAVAPQTAPHVPPNAVTITPITLPKGSATEVLSVSSNGDVYYSGTTTPIPGFCLYITTGSCLASAPDGLFRYSGGTITEIAPHGPYSSTSPYTPACVATQTCSIGNVSAIDAAQFASPLWASDYTAFGGTIPFSGMQSGGTAPTADIPPPNYNHDFSHLNNEIVSINSARNGQFWIGGGGSSGSSIYPAAVPKPCVSKGPPFPCDIFFVANGPGQDVWAMARTYKGKNQNPTGTAFFVFTPSGGLKKTYTTSIVAVRMAGTSHGVWFTDWANNAIGKINPGGHIKEWTIPTKGAGPYGITVGGDGALWFTEYNSSKVGRITMNGHIEEFNLGFQGFSIAATPPGCKNSLVYVGDLNGDLAVITDDVP